MKNVQKSPFAIFLFYQKIMAKIIRIKFTGYVFLLAIISYCPGNVYGQTDSRTLFYTAFDASIVPQSYELNQGDILKIKIDCKNRGNTEIAPDIDFKIKREDATVYSAIFPYPEDRSKIQPFSASEISNIAIPTGSLETGKYRAVLKISENDSFWIDKEFAFSIGEIKSENAASGVYSPYDNFWSVSRITSAAVILFFLFFFTEWYLNGKKSR